jgi:hypothetical protein
MTRVAIPAITALLTVASLVGLSGWNRSAEPRQIIELTERELRLPFGYDDGLRDGAPLELHLEVEYRYEPLDARNWLSEDRLRALGFSLGVPVSSQDAAASYRRVPPRIGWVVFEYDGPAFQEIERRRLLEREKRKDEPYRGQPEPSRLVPVDAGPDFDALRARYPSGHLIARAIVNLSYLGPNDRGPLLYGTIKEIVPSTISVPAYLRAPLMSLPARASSEPDGPHTLVPPRYTAEVASGPLGILYLRTVRRIGG